MEQQKVKEKHKHWQQILSQAKFSILLLISLGANCFIYTLASPVASSFRDRGQPVACKSGETINLPKFFPQQDEAKLECFACWCQDGIIECGKKPECTSKSSATITTIATTTSSTTTNKNNRQQHDKRHNIKPKPLASPFVRVGSTTYDFGPARKFDWSEAATGLGYDSVDALKVMIEEKKQVIKDRNRQKQLQEQQQQQQQSTQPPTTTTSTTTTTTTSVPTETESEFDYDTTISIENDVALTDVDQNIDKSIPLSSTPTLTSTSQPPALSSSSSEPPPSTSPPPTPTLNTNLITGTLIDTNSFGWEHDAEAWLEANPEPTKNYDQSNYPIILCIISLTAVIIMAILIFMIFKQEAFGIIACTA